MFITAASQPLCGITMGNMMTEGSPHFIVLSGSFARNLTTSIEWHSKPELPHKSQMSKPLSTHLLKNKCFVTHLL